MSLDQGLQVQKVTLVGDMVEFVTKDLGLYAIVYKEQNQEPVKPVEQAHEPAVKGENFENASEKVDSADFQKQVKGDLIQPPSYGKSQSCFISGSTNC